jgi:catechol 2,3-dioxygenase-like lactoylglutathione lyase family enzyme
MIDHTGIGVADVSRSATFYDAALEALGMRRVMRFPIRLGPTALATVSTILSSGSIDTTHTLSNSI